MTKKYQDIDFCDPKTHDDPYEMYDYFMEHEPLTWDAHNELWQVFRYDDIVRVDAKRKLLGGRKVEIDVNQGRATVTESIDFSGRPDAAEYVERFLREAMLASPVGERVSGTDLATVQRALDRLVADGLLAEVDRASMLAALTGK